jgi:hypothetical protein
VGPWEMVTAEVVGGAGGTAGAAGDYFYGDLRRPFTKAGMWGLQRVLPVPAACPAPGTGKLQCVMATLAVAPTAQPVALTAGGSPPGSGDLVLAQSALTPRRRGDGTI